MRPWIPLFFALTLLTTPLLADTPSAATGTSTIAVAWRTTGGTIAAAVISQSGQLVSRLALGSGTAAPALAFDGVRYLAVWPNGSINGRFFDESGNLSDALPPHGAAADVPPAISWNGADFFLVYLDAAGDRYHVEALNAQGTFENATEITTGVSPLFFAPSVAVASSGTTTLVAVAWASSSTGLAYLDTLAFDSSLHVLTQTRLDSAPIGGGGSVPQTPDVAASPAGFLVTWLSSGTVRAARVGLDGMAIDAMPLTIDVAPTSESVSNPRVTWDGTKFFETWTRTSTGLDAGTWVSAITATGQTTAPTQIVGDTRPADVTGITPGRDVIVWTSDTRIDLGIVGVATERRRAAGR